MWKCGKFKSEWMSTCAPLFCLLFAQPRTCFIAVIISCIFPSFHWQTLSTSWRVTFQEKPQYKFANSDVILARQNDTGLRQQGGIHQHLHLNIFPPSSWNLECIVYWDQSAIFTRPILANLILTLLLRSWLNVYMQKFSCFIGAGCNADLTATKYCQPVLSLLNSKLATKHLCESQENFSTQNRWRIFKLKGFSFACSCLPVIIVTIVIIIMTIIRRHRHHHHD